MDRAYSGAMTVEELERLTHKGDISPTACAIRLAAAIKMTGVQHQELAKAAGFSSKSSISNILSGSQLPPYSLLKHLHRVYGLDFNFMIHGDFAHFRPDTQERLFAALEAANSEWDQRQRLDRSRASATRDQA